MGAFMGAGPLTEEGLEEARELVDVSQRVSFAFDGFEPLQVPFDYCWGCRNNYDLMELTETMNDMETYDCKPIQPGCVYWYWAWLTDPVRQTSPVYVGRDDVVCKNAFGGFDHIEPRELFVDREVAEKYRNQALDILRKMESGALAEELRDSVGKTA